MKKFKRASYSLPPHLSYPAISVVIPLYNVEKYIGECLDSLLAQTFKNFEVIVVDDCSTDSSPAIVESYAEKFGGRLLLTRMKKNSGGAGFPRNKGVELSRGEYIYFIDPDDAITPTALEELYTHAKNFDTDVVHCEKWYNIPDHLWNNAEYRANPSHDTYPAKEKIFITKPTFLADDFEKRILDYRKRWLTWSVCLQLIRRNFILEHELKFGDFYCEDTVFTLCEISCAKKYLVVPNIVYNYRSKRENSAVNEKLSPFREFHKQFKALEKSIRYLDKFLTGLEFYSKRPDLKYIFFDFVAQDRFGYFNKIYAQVPTPALDELVRKEFDGGDNLALTSYIFNKLNVQHLQLNQTQHNFNQFAAQAQSQVQKFNQFAQQAQRRIAELEAEVKRLQGK